VKVTIRNIFNIKLLLLFNLRTSTSPAICHAQVMVHWISGSCLIYKNTIKKSGVII